jgi:NADH-ubiquinone oxidoreductase chain 2
MLDKNNSPVQLISQLRGYFYINPYLALSLTITIFSFAGIPPLIGFFAKQMVLSAALDNGYVFLTLVAILTSVIGAIYYLNVIKEIFFYTPEYKLNSIFKNNNFLNLTYDLLNISKNSVVGKKTQNNDYEFKYSNISMSSSISITISIITLVIVLFILMNKE